MYLTISATAKEKNLPEFLLRTMLKEERLPGFFSGRRFYVNTDLLMAQLQRESAEAVKDHSDK